MLSNLSTHTIDSENQLKFVNTSGFTSIYIGGLDLFGKPLLIKFLDRFERTNEFGVVSFYNKPITSDNYVDVDITSETIGYQGVRSLSFGNWGGANFLKLKLTDAKVFEKYSNLQSLVINHLHSASSNFEISGEVTSNSFRGIHNIEHLEISLDGFANMLLFNWNKEGLFPNLKNLTLKCLTNNIRQIGNVIYLPRNLEYIDLTGAYSTTSITISGKISDFPKKINSLTANYLTNASFSGYEQTNWLGENITRIEIERVILTSTELDQLLIDFSVANWATTETGVLRLIQRTTGSIGVRTSASDSAVALLQSKGVTITISNNTF